MSCTGSGEAIIRTLLAHSIARAVEGDATPSKACERSIAGGLTDAGGLGGAIAVDANGNLGMCFNNAVMNRAWKDGDQTPTVAIT